MIKTEYICDRCNKHQESNVQFWKIKLIVDAIDAPDRYLEYPKKTADWCRICCEEFGMLPSTKEVKEDIPVVLEDILREIIREEIDNANT